MLSDILNTEVDLEVVDTVENGNELVKSAAQLRPDLIIADYHLPKNSRMFAFRRIKIELAIPVLLLVGNDVKNDDFIFEAMKFGVYDYVKISSQTRYPQFRSIQEEITCKVRAVMDIKNVQTAISLRQHVPVLNKTAFEPFLVERSVQYKHPNSYIVIGASTGGTKAIESIVKSLSSDLGAAVLIALHLPDEFTRTFTQRIKRLTTLKVVEGKAGLRLEAGKIIIAPGDKNMMVSRNMSIKTDLRINFSHESSNEFDQPSVDILMKSVAGLVGKCTLGIILTGMGTDGTEGVKAILSEGGETIAQDEASSVIFGMAKSAIEKGYITKVLGLDQIPDYINRFAEYHRI